MKINLFFLRDLLWRNPFQRWFLFFLITVNFLGSLYGFLWYRYQLEVTPWWIWPLVADSPFSTTLFFSALFMVLLGRHSGFLLLWGCLGVIKYGIWALVLITNNWFLSGMAEPVEVMLWLSHLGMVLEGVIFLRHVSFRRVEVVAVLFWFTTNDFVDYALGFHPYLFQASQKAVALITALMITACFVILTTYAYRSRPRK